MNNMFKCGNEAEAVARYGPIQNGQWPGEKNWGVMVPMPEWFSAQVMNPLTGKPCVHIYMNKDLQEPFLAALGNVEAAGVGHEIKTLDGCYNVRSVRGIPGAASLHSWAIAVDMNAGIMPLGAVSTWSPEFVKCFTDVGFAWGGNFKRLDPQHFSWGWE